MRIATTAGPVTIDPADTVADTILRREATEPERVTIRRKVAGQWRPVTVRQFLEDAYRFAGALVGSGVGPGDRVVILGRTRYEWTVADYGIWLAGAVGVPIYETSSPEQISYIVGDSGAIAAVVEHPEHAAEVALAGIPAERIWTIEKGDLEQLPEADRRRVDAQRAGRGADDIATLVYTSGTTGRPKGCVLTHRNLIYEARAVVDAFAEALAPDRSDEILLFLPLAHVLARAVELICMQGDAVLGHTLDVANLAPDLAGFAPTIIPAVPRVLEKVFGAARATAQASRKGRIFDRAVAVATDADLARSRHGTVPRRLALEWRLYDRLVYRRLRAALGGRARVAILGGSTLEPNLGHFFAGIGIQVLIGYGLTETMAAITVSPPSRPRLETVGRPLPGTSVAVSDDGEVLVTGGPVFRGYWNQAETTAGAFDEAGWFHTGDLGTIDDGYLSITGRKKELIITAAGKNVSPAPIEDAIRACPLVGQVMLVGDDKPFVAALVTLDPDVLPGWLRSHGLDPTTPPLHLVDDSAIRAEIEAQIVAVNKTVSRAESVRKFRILPVFFSEATGEITPSLKLKRHVVAERYATEIAALYR